MPLRPATAFESATSAAPTADGLRASVWEAALRAAGGNIAEASASFGFSRQRGHTLTVRHGLLPLAKALRAERRRAKAADPGPLQGKELCQRAR